MISEGLDALPSLCSVFRAAVACNAEPDPCPGLPTEEKQSIHFFPCYFHTKQKRKCSSTNALQKRQMWYKTPCDLQRIGLFRILRFAFVEAASASSSS